MTKPLAYDPQPGYKYQILVQTPYDRVYEHCDYAADSQEKKHLLEEYKLAYGAGHYFKVMPLPKKYWNQNIKEGN